ncbi:MAG: PRC-barrel domain-containing protein [Rubrobacteraceae bacterium]
MVYGEHGDPFAEFKRDHEGYRVYDAHYENIGKADELFVDEVDHPLYIGVKTGLLEARVVLVPLEIIRINDKRQVVEISGEADQVRHAPSLGDNEDLTPDLEARVHGYFGLASPLTPEQERPTASHPDPLLEEELATDIRIDVEPGERQETAERFEEAPPARASRAEAPRDVPPRRAEQVSPPREAGKEWARGTERLPAEDGAGDTATNPRLTRARRLRR